MEKGKIYLIPTTLGDTAETADVLPVKVNEIINSIDEYIVENEKAARHYLKKMGIKIPCFGRAVGIISVNLGD